MHFSRVVDGPDRDLELLFRGAVASRWTEESFSSLHDGPDAFPKCPDPRWAQWTYPLIQVMDSRWLLTYLDNAGAEGRCHFLLISMNDLLDVLALPDVAANWIDAT
jgi:hypothetical protein